MLDTRGQGLGSMLERFARSLALRERERVRARARLIVYPFFAEDHETRTPNPRITPGPSNAIPRSFWGLFGLCDAILWAFIAKS